MAFQLGSLHVSLLFSASLWMARALALWSPSKDPARVERSADAECVAAVEEVYINGALQTNFAPGIIERVQQHGIFLAGDDLNKDAVGDLLDNLKKIPPLQRPALR